MAKHTSGISKKRQEQILSIVEVNPIIRLKEIVKITGLQDTTISNFLSSCGLTYKKRIIAHINKHLDELNGKCTFRDIAESTGISYTFIKRNFSEHEKVASKSVIQKQKITDYLKDKVEIKDIYQEAESIGVPVFLLGKIAEEHEIAVNKAAVKKAKKPKLRKSNHAAEIQRSSKIRISKIILMLLRNPSGLTARDITSELIIDRGLLKQYIMTIRDAGFDVENTGYPNYFYVLKPENSWKQTK